MTNYKKEIESSMVLHVGYGEDAERLRKELDEVYKKAKAYDRVKENYEQRVKELELIYSETARHDLPLIHNSLFRARKILNMLNSLEREGDEDEN